MIVFRPLTIRAAELTSSTVSYPDTGETAWVTATSYVVGDTRSYTIDGLLMKFECIQNHTSSATNAPKAYPNENAFWLDLGAVNRYRMFHLERNNQTEGASPLVVEITPNMRFGGLAISRVEADELRVEVYDGATQIYDTSHTLVSRVVSGWFDWLYQPFRFINNFIVLDLPILTTAKLKLTFTKATGNVKVGPMVLGIPYTIGKTQYKARARGQNFTTVERAFDGTAKITRRRSIPKTSQVVAVEKSDLDKGRNLINELNGVVTVWSGLSNPLDGYFNSIFVIGFYRDTEYSIDHPEVVFLNMEIEGI
jgi:hypothetical protein